MFTSISIYFIMVFLIFWAYCGYIITLYVLLIIVGNNKKTTKSEEFPFVSILVPCYNEADLVEDKLKNLNQLDYPKDKLEVIFVDGRSKDGTYEAVEKAINGLDHVSAVQSKARGKINQLNYILPKTKGEIIVNTDMDCLLERGSLKELIKEFSTDKKVALVGAHVVPKDAMFFEEKYWSNQNQLRILESRVHSSSIVIAPCYGFKKGLIEQFPKDCIADDIYISFYANMLRRKSKYAEKAIAYEVRSPDNLNTLLSHKFRKGNAYIIELLRFMHKLPVMHPTWKLIFLTKFLQVIIIPWIIPFFVLCSISLILSGGGAFFTVVYSAIFLFTGFLITHFLIERKRKVPLKKKGYLPNFSVFIVANVILLLNGILFPFYRQTSSYNRISSKEDNNV